MFEGSSFIIVDCAQQNRSIYTCPFIYFFAITFSPVRLWSIHVIPLHMNKLITDFIIIKYNDIPPPPVLDFKNFNNRQLSLKLTNSLPVSLLLIVDAFKQPPNVHTTYNLTFLAHRWLYNYRLLFFLLVCGCSNDHDQWVHFFVSTEELLLLLLPIVIDIILCNPYYVRMHLGIWTWLK